MQKLDTICQLAKSLKTAVAKGDSGAEVVTCEIKFSALPIPREMMDELLGLPVGWSQKCVFDDQGAPLRLLSISSAGRALRVTGKIAGPKGHPALVLLQAELTDVALSLVTLGAVCEGKLTWTARGDEVEDVAELLGKTCTAVWQITDGEQDDLFDAHRGASRETVNTIIDGLGRGQPAP